MQQRTHRATHCKHATCRGTVIRDWLINGNRSVNHNYLLLLIRKFERSDVRKIGLRLYTCVIVLIKARTKHTPRSAAPAAEVSSESHGCRVHLCKREMEHFNEKNVLIKKICPWRNCFAELNGCWCNYCILSISIFSAFLKTVFYEPTVATPYTSRNLWHLLNVWDLLYLLGKLMYSHSTSDSGKLVLSKQDRLLFVRLWEKLSQVWEDFACVSKLWPE